MIGEIDMQTIGERIKALREAHNWTQAQLGAKIGLSGVSVTNWEKGYNELKYKNAIKLARVLGTTHEYIMTGQHSTTGKLNDLLAQLTTMHEEQQLTEQDIDYLRLSVSMMLQAKQTTHQQANLDDDTN